MISDIIENLSFQHSNAMFACCKSLQVDSTYVNDLMKASRAFNLTLRPFLGRYDYYKYQHLNFTNIYKKADNDNDKMNGKDTKKNKTAYLYFNSNEKHWAVRLLT